MKNKKIEEFSTNIAFEEDPKIIRDYMKREGYPENQHSDLIILFKEFLKFYSKDGLFIKNLLRINVTKGKI